MSMTAETTVPVLMIAEDWALDDVETLEDCEDAFAVLMERIAELENDKHRAHSYFCETGKRAPWHDKSISDFKMAKATLTLLQNRRMRIARREKESKQRTRDEQFIDLFRKHEPEAFARVVELAKVALDR